VKIVKCVDIVQTPEPCKGVPSEVYKNLHLTMFSLAPNWTIFNLKPPRVFKKLICSFIGAPIKVA